jgi:ferric-dicitrate binding protein FerR (iron transport regulator)
MEENYLAKWIDDAQGYEVDDPIYRQLKQVSAQLDAPAFDKKAVFEQIQQRKAQRKTKLVPWFIAATLILLIGLGALYLLNQRSVATQVMASQSFQLPDASSVVLQSGSKLSFNNLTWPISRQVHLEGSAFFDVEKGKKFIVKTSEGIVKVLGTKFKVSTFQELLQVRCYEGRVSVEKNGKSAIISAGERIIIDEKGQPKLMKDLDGSFRSSGQKEYYLYNRKLADIFTILKDIYGVKITTKVNSSKHYTGSIPLYDLEKTLDIISKTYQIGYQQQAENNYIFVDNDPAQK